MTSAFTAFRQFRSYYEKLPDIVRAISIMIIAMVGFALMSATIKSLGQTLHVTEIIVIRQFVMVLIMLPAIVRMGRQSGHMFRVNRKDLLLLRACLTFASILAGFTAIINLPLATATTLSFTRTFFITVFAVLILKETVGPRRIGALVVGFCGILIIARPFELLEGGLSSLDPNILLAVFAAATVAANQIIVRIHTRYDHPTLLVGGQALIIGIAMIPLAWYNWQQPTLEELCLVIMTGLLAGVAQWLMVHSFKLAEATALAPFDYLRLIFTTALGWFMFAEWPDHFTWIGASIIFASTYYIMRREAKLKKPQASQPVV